MSERYSTPQNFYNELDKEFGFQLYVCAEDWNHKCDRYFTPEDDGLSQDWTGIVWMNPPYGHKTKYWIKKAYEESQKGNALVVCLVPARTDAPWFHDYCLKGEVRFIRGRVHFIFPDGRSERPRFGSAVVIFRPPIDCIGCQYEEAFPGCPAAAYCRIHMNKKIKAA